MIAYGEYSKNIAQKIFLLLLELIVIWISFLILFRGLGDTVLAWFKIYPTGGNHLRRTLIFTFNVVVFLVYAFSILFFVKRKITWAEAFNVTIAFGVYYLGFALLGYNIELAPNWIDLLGIILFIFGVSLHFASELQRYNFKKKPENKDKLITTGFWAWSRHVNYFADLLWVSGYALVTRNPWSWVIVALLFVFFAFVNIPIQEKYLQQKYGDQFQQYKSRTKAFIPLIF